MAKIMRFTFLYNFLWTVPFVAFIIGYHTVGWVTYKTNFVTPAVIGCHIHDAITLLSAYQLNTRILSQKEDQDLPEGIILSQVPHEGQKIKAQQSVFLVVNRHPAKPKAPGLYSLSLEQAQQKAKKQDIYLKAYSIESKYPINSCIAQNIQPGMPVEQKELVAYFSAQAPALRIMPDFKHRTVNEVTEFLKIHDIKPVIAHIYMQDTSHTCSSCIIMHQRPSAGSIIDLSKPPTVHLIVYA